jgi:AraC-like DNA-binding protein
MPRLDLYTSLAHDLYSQDIPIRLVRRKHDGHSFELTFHSHDFIELVIITEGSATHHVQLTNGRSYQYPIGKGSVFMMNIGESHIYTFTGKESIVVENILFDPAVLNYLNINVGNDVKYLDFIYLLPQLEPEVRFNELTQLDGQSLQQLEFLIQFLNTEQSSSRPGSASIQLMLLGMIISLICRQYTENSGFPRYSLQVQSTNILRVVGFIQQHYCEDITMKQLAKIALCGERHLARRFKSITGQTVTEYVRELRIAKASYLLRHTDMKVTEIASQTGFNDCSFFIRVFRERMYLTPLEYKTANPSKLEEPAAGL